MNMANAYMLLNGDFTKAEEMLKLSLHGYEKSLGKEHDSTNKCAKYLAIYLDR